MDDLTTYIYALTDPTTNNIKYVGKSDDPKERLKNHIRKCKYVKTHKNNWLQQLKNNNLEPNLIILDEVLVCEWGFWETYWISQIKSWGFTLTNLTNGGDGGNFGGKVNKKISEKLKGRKFGENTLELMSESAKKRKLTDEGRKSLSIHRKGSNNPMFGRTQSKHCIESKHKPVTQYSLSGDFIKEWESLKKVSEYLCINRNTIRMVCNNQRKSAGGYIWKFNLKKNEN
jgi:hypothetical protein